MTMPPAGQHYQPQFAPPPDAHATYRGPGGRALADPGQRLAAKIIDSLVVLAPLLVLLAGSIAAVIGLVSANRETPELQGVLIVVGVLAGLLVVTVGSALLSYLYVVVYQVRTGSTIGKRAMKIRTVRLDDGAALDLSSGRRRWLASEGVNLLGLIPVVNIFTGMYAWADALWLLWDRPLQQCLHDKYARTIVVQLTEADLMTERTEPSEPTEARA